MSTWAVASRMEGYRLSPIFDISNQYDSLETIVTWHETLPVGSTLTVESNVSFNGGITWEGWKPVTQGGSIFGLMGDVDLSDCKLQFKQTVKNTLPDVESRLSDMTIQFTPLIFFQNDGDLNCKPEVWITMENNGDASIINTTNEGKEFKFTGLVNAETVYVDNENEDIETDLPMTYRYSSFNDEYMECLRGRNVLRIVGNFKLKFRYQFKTLQG